MRRSLLPLLLCSIGICLSYAEKVEPCLIFSGNAEQNKALPLAIYNRISFGENSMTVSSPDDAVSSVELPYSDYNRFNIGEDIISEVQPISDSGIELTFDSSSNTLLLMSTCDTVVEVSIFGIDGKMILCTDMRRCERLSLNSLPEGVYVAVASGEAENHKIKFIK